MSEGEEVTYMAEIEAMPGRPDWSGLLFEMLRAILEVLLKWLAQPAQVQAAKGRDG